ncbi:MAG TPA: hypothetical protein PLS81_04530 [Deltaproteobacteria bacterium]|nr:hypothetical protein [Deltaproteobacteria bacterium]HOM28704.1 hypothetical protein [Deltaproteobacteria bacterium]HPP80471.1 hypothetical protein [Deltaproteobacteria bacterium]
MAGTGLVMHLDGYLLKEALETEDSPILLACIRDDQPGHDIVQSLGSVASQAGEVVRVCYITEELFSCVKDRFCIVGTPTFLLIHKGRLVDRLLGKATTLQILRFVSTGLARGALTNSQHERTNNP